MRNGKFEPGDDKTPVRTEEAAILREFLGELAAVEKKLRPFADHLESIGEDEYRSVLKDLTELVGQVGEVGHDARRKLWNRLHRRRG